MIEEYGVAAPLGLSIAVNFVVSPSAGVTAKLKKIIASARMMDSQSVGSGGRKHLALRHLHHHHLTDVGRHVRL
jgi:hypothetical protein